MGISELHPHFVVMGVQVLLFLSYVLPMFLGIYV
jgi:hypothetical protein